MGFCLIQINDWYSTAWIINTAIELKWTDDDDWWWWLMMIDDWWWWLDWWWLDWWWWLMIDDDDWWCWCVFRSLISVIRGQFISVCGAVAAADSTRLMTSSYTFALSISRTSSSRMHGHKLSWGHSWGPVSQNSNPKGESWGGDLGRRQIEYQPVSLGLRRGVFTCVGWQVTLWRRFVTFYISTLVILLLTVWSHMASDIL